MSYFAVTGKLDQPGSTGTAPSTNQVPPTMLHSSRAPRRWARHRGRPARRQRTKSHPRPIDCRRRERGGDPRSPDRRSVGGRRLSRDDQHRALGSAGGCRGASNGIAPQSTAGVTCSTSGLLGSPAPVQGGEVSTLRASGGLHSTVPANSMVILICSRYAAADKGFGALGRCCFRGEPSWRWSEVSMTIAVSKIGHLVLRVSDRSCVDPLLSTNCLVCTRSHAVTSAGVRWRSCQQGTLITTWPSSRRTSRQGVHSTTSHSRSERLADVRAALDAAGLTVHMALDHRVSQGPYISDPDGNLIELYVDAPQQTWREDPSPFVANSDPLTL